jgi:glycine/D-amino acid oxidase-like deaminating enzyme
MQAHYDFLIAGQGLAGTVLSYTLHKAGFNVLVIDDARPVTCTKVAAGLFNPITGRKMVKTWRADDLFPFLHRFYTTFEHDTGASFFHPRPLYRPFESLAQQNDVLAQVAEKHFADYVESTNSDSQFGSYVHNQYGGIVLKQAGFVDTEAMLKAWYSYLHQHRMLMEAELAESELEITPGGVRWRNLSADRIIFCRGAADAASSYFSWLPFRPVKGEILEGHFPFSTNTIINRGCWVAPRTDGLYKAGATYHWHALNEEASQEARAELMDKLSQLIKEPFRLTRQQAGIRPATADRKPFIGMHPQYPRLGIFNGMGAKGVSLSPYFAKQFMDSFTGSDSIDSQVDINRYWQKT